MPDEVREINLSEDLDNSFIEKTKSEILAKSNEDIFTFLREYSTDSKSEGQRGYVSGGLFEIIAITEKTTLNPETKIQKQFRRVVQEAFKNSGLLLGKRKEPSIPDDTTVIFNENGEPEIVEIVEMKLSKSGVKPKQPQKTLDTMDSVVDLINHIIEGKKPYQILPEDDLNPKLLEKRKKLLQRLQNQINSFHLKQKLTFSPNLKYTCYFPKGEEINMYAYNNVRPHNKIGEVEMQFQSSIFSKKDIHDIIDHYAETP